jgi:hypothetical protein
MFFLKERKDIISNIEQIKNAASLFQSPSLHDSDIIISEINTIGAFHFIISSYFQRSIPKREPAIYFISCIIKILKNISKQL